MTVFGNALLLMNANQSVMLSDLTVGIWFVFSLYISTLLFAYRLSKRKFWQYKLIFGSILYFSLHLLYNFLLFKLSLQNNVMLLCGRYVFAYFILLGLVQICYDCRLSTSVFCVTCGYSTQHIISRTLGIVKLVLHEYGVNLSKLSDDVICGIILLIVLALIYYIFGRCNSTGRDIEISRPSQLIVSTLLLCVVIFIEQVTMDLIIHADFGMKLLSFLSSFVFAVIIIMLEFNLLIRRDVELERDILQSIIEQEHKQYVVEKNIIDVINIKSHDLKHQLMALNADMRSESIDKLHEAVAIYDLNIKTGNSVLDVVLTTKSFLCHDKKIELTCLADGKKLSFMQEADIYSLFGNILDNAIEATEKLEDEEKRIISLTVREEKGLIVIHAENYCISDGIKFSDGLPVTTKDNTDYHGFGLKSIKLITQNYGGNLNIQVNDDIFTIDIIFESH